MADLPANATARLISAAASDNATVISAAQAYLTGITGYNAAAAGRYLKLYDKATAPTTADTPRKTIYLPATSGFALVGFDVFHNGLSFRITNLGADADATLPTAGDILGLNLDYRT